MKYVIRLSWVVVLAVMAINVQAQKFGYLNSSELLAELSEVAEMRSNLEGLNTQLQKKGQQMVKIYQDAEAEAMRKKEKGEMAPVEEEKVMADLQTKQNEIVKFEQDMQAQMTKKQNELLEPILKKVNDAINAVAKEDGLTYVFDSSTGIVLYADEALNVMSKVKAKLGLAGTK